MFQCKPCGQGTNYRSILQLLGGYFPRCVGGQYVQFALILFRVNQVMMPVSSMRHSMPVSIKWRASKRRSNAFDTVDNFVAA